MTKKKVLKKLQDFFDLDERRKKAHIGELIKILKKLKKKEKNILAKLEHETDTEKQHILQKELDILFAQRKKGTALIKELSSDESEATDYSSS